ncbi:lysylphosphatidylglycerol synthase transmembrane domain-containing protein [Bdellovibrio sp. BCCA]|uniref:lysylphosphatidylglycerol synthase transmembrane domain-containing protein n=1 Tax=Bdellovibrio sp. BCCA TaxID=3136281 RepID=UPI0030F04EEB
MVKQSKKLLVQSLKILFSAGIIFWLIQSGKLNFSALKNLLTPGAAALALFLVLLNLFFASERWRILIRSQGMTAHPWSVFKLSLIGTFFNFAMPGGVGGDVIKAYYFTRENPGSKVVAVTSVLMDRVLGLFAMVLLALVVMVYDINHIMKTPALLTLLWFIAGLFVAFVIALSLIFSQKVYQNGGLKRLINKLPLSEKFMKLYESMHLYGKDGKRFLLVIFLSLVSQACAITFLYLAGSMAGFNDVPAKTYFLVAPLGFMATAIPISPAGVGVGQAAFYFLFNLYTGHPSEIGPTSITAFQVGTFLMSLWGAFFYLRRKDRVETTEIAAN